jgi:hypothetical protein
MAHGVVWPAATHRAPFFFFSIVFFFQTHAGEPGHAGTRFRKPRLPSCLEELGPFQLLVKL